MTKVPGIIVGLLLGCSFAESAQDSASNYCDDDSQCASLQCDLEQNVCVSEGAADGLRYALEVNRPGSIEGTGSSDFSSLFALGEVERHEFVILDPVDIFGTVRSTDALGHTTRMLGQLRFVREGPVPQLRTQLDTQLLSQASTTPEGREFDFSLRLLPGRYGVAVTLDELLAEQFPPGRFTLDISGRIEGPIAFPYPDPDELCLFHGRTYDSMGEGINGLRVQAVDAVSEEVLSTVDTTRTVSRVAGMFVIRLPNGLRDYRLHLSPVDSEMIYPTVTVDPALLFPHDNCQDVRDIELPDVVSPTAVTLSVSSLIPSIPMGMPVQPSMSGGNEINLETPAQVHPVGGATVRLVSAPVSTGPGLVSRYRVSGVTDASGEVTLQAVQGNYTLVVVPSGSDPSLAVHAEPFSISESDGGTDRTLRSNISLRARQQLTGYVKTSHGQAMRGAVIQVMARRSSRGFQETLAALYNRSEQTQTDADGMFRVGLDEGLYDMTVQTVPDSGFPWMLIPSVRIDRDFDNDNFKDIVLPEPRVLTGTVKNAVGDSIENADIKVHGLVGSGEQLRVINLGSVKSDADGRYRLLLAPAQPANFN